MICPGTTIKFFDRSSNDPTSWSWTFPGGNPAVSSDQHPTVTYDIAGTYPVILEVGNGAGDNSQTFSNVITVADGGQSFPLYQDFDDGFQDWTVVNPDNAMTWEITSPGAAPGGNAVAFINNFSYPVLGQRDAVVSPEFSLAGYQSATLHVEYAHATFTSGLRDSLIVAVSGDGGQSFQRFYANAENGSGNFATRPSLGVAFNPQSFDDWCGVGGFGAACIDVDISNFLGSRDVIVRIENYTNSGNNTYIDRIYVTTNCFDLPAPVAAFSAQPQSGCAPLVVQFTDQSQHSPLSWQWTFQNGSPATSNEPNPEVIYSTPGIYAVSLTVENESGVDVAVENAFIEVIGDPTALFTYTSTGSTVFFDNMSTDATNYLWDFGDGESSQDEDPAHTYALDDSYDVVLHAFNDCGSHEFNTTVVIGTIPVASYDASALSGCVPHEVQFLNTSSVNTTDVLWIFEGGDPSSSSIDDPLVTYNSPGTYDVTLIAINGSGADTLIDENIVEISDAPPAAFSFDINGLEVTFTNLSVGADDYSWTFGDGHSSSDEDPIHTYATENAYTVTLISSNACGADTAIQTVGLGGFPSATFTSDVSTGCAPLTVQFNAENAGMNDNILWTFDGGNPSTSTAKDPIVTYAVAGMYPVQCIVSNVLGSDTAFIGDYILVQGAPETDFQYLHDGFLTFDFEYTGEAYDQIQWFFGDGNTSSDENPSHQYDFDISGGIEVTCITQNACGSDTLVRRIDFVYPIVAITLPPATVCAGSQVQFMAEGLALDLEYNWVFEGGNPATSTLSNPVVVYPASGLYDVSLTTSKDGASLSYFWMERVMVEDEPIADFDPQNDFMANLSLNATSYSWYVDGIFASHDENYRFGAGGDYEVMLIATNSCGADTLVQNVMVSSTSGLPVLKEGMKVVPNPNNASFRLMFDKIPSDYKMEMLDSRGRVVVNMNSSSNDDFSHSLPGLSNGVYLVRVATEWGIYTSKMVVIR